MITKSRLVAAAPFGALVALLLGACSSGGGSTLDPVASTSHATTATKDPVTINVYAAASLTDVFTEIAADFTTEHPEADIRFTFAGSSDLASQINEGAPADVFASANEKQMDAASEHIDGTAEVFASNTLIIAVPAGNPAGITDFASLAKPGVVVVVCATEVPCGAATKKVEKSLGVTLSPVSELTNVTDVLGSVASGEADAGLVYVTDIARAKGVEGIPFAGSDAASTRCPIAVLKRSADSGQARAFVQYVLGPQGLAALASAGFGPPDGAAS